MRHAQQLDADALPATLNVAELRWAMGDLVMIAQSDHERERYEARRKMQRDVYTELAIARDEGRVEGLVAGQMTRIQSFQRLLGLDVTAADQLRLLPAAQLESLASRLEAELSEKLRNGGQAAQE